MEARVLWCVLAVWDDMANAEHQGPERYDTGERRDPWPRFSETVVIAAGRERVWRALSNPAEVVQWDTGVVSPLDAPSDYPRPGQYVRWRYRLGPLRLILHDRPTRVEAGALLRSSIRLGPFEFDETYTLASPRPSETTLNAALSVASRLPLVGRLLAWTIGRPLARATVRTSLAAIKHRCETTP